MPNKIVKNKDQQLEIKGKNKIFDKTEKSNPENLQLLSPLKKKELPEKRISKSKQETIELLSPIKKKNINLEEIEPTNLEIKAKERIIEKTQPYNLELLKNKKEINLLKDYPSSFEINKTEKPEIPLQKINKDSFHLKGTNEDEEQYEIEDKYNKSIGKNKYILRSGKSSKPIYNENDMDNIKKDSNSKMYQMLLLNLSQLLKNKYQNYQRDFLNRLKDNLFKINVEEEIKKQKEEIEKEKEKDIELIMTKKKTNLEEQKEKSKLFTTTQNSLEYEAEENPKLRIRKRNLQSLSSENYSDNYLNVLIDYLKKRIALQNWYNKMMALKNSKRIRITGRKIGEGIKRHIIIDESQKKRGNFKTNLLRFPFEQIRREAKRRILIKALLNIQNLKYPSLEYGFLKLKRYSQVKYQVMNAYATLIQRFYRFYVQYIKTKKVGIAIIENEENTVIETVQYRRRIQRNYENLYELFCYLYKKILIRYILQILYVKNQDY
jgi:hypothetical protein